MPEGTLLIFPYSVRRQTLKRAKSGFLHLVPQNALSALAQTGIFTTAFARSKHQAIAGLE